ncbi:hypothetical protein MLD38_038847 [Melastoma candidum]|uniref:Uncharacterized protein n=1 Tax=Melastoma candidum TaxID=119954 RepID=A0ACB9L127_9MYRT|nr:hypothetical protein MLD38_038847 [Melastoma candidum]
MAAGTVATAAGAAVILYIVLRRTLSPDNDGGDGSALSKSRAAAKRRPRRSPPAAQAPSTVMESIGTVADTLRFTYSETLGKWPLGDLAFGIKYLMRRQGNIPAASIYGGSNCVELRGPEIVADLKHLLRLLILCRIFSKKPFPVFLETSGILAKDVLIQKPKAGLLKPAFTIIREENDKCFLLLIRGTHSIKDTLTAATGAVVPFHHSVLDGGGISNLVLGYAHCGMVAAARWIAKISSPCLLKALKEYPDYQIKVVGHSLGGGTAALLTYILREHKEFCNSTCVTFAPAACMTWDLAESGKHFVTSIINGSDIVPTFSATSVDYLRSEVTASSWLNDLRDQVRDTRVVSVVYRSATAIGSRLPSMASAKARVAGAGAMLRPVSSHTQVMMKSAQTMVQAVVRTRTSFSAWSCMGARHRKVGVASISNSEVEDGTIHDNITESLITIKQSGGGTLREDNHCPNVGPHDDSSDEEKAPDITGITTSPALEEDVVTLGELWKDLEEELQRQEKELNNVARDAEVAIAAKEITREEISRTTSESVIRSTATSSSLEGSTLDNHQFYPPGRTMHIVAMPTQSDTEGQAEEHLRLYETPRELYSKIRLSRTMIDDHYMPAYRTTIESLISQLEADLGPLAIRPV